MWGSWAATGGDKSKIPAYVLLHLAEWSCAYTAVIIHTQPCIIDQDKVFLLNTVANNWKILVFGDAK